MVVAGVSCSHRQLPGQGPFVVACRAWTPHYRILVALVEKVLDCAGCAITCSFDWFDCHLQYMYTFIHFFVCMCTRGVCVCVCGTSQEK